MKYLCFARTRGGREFSRLVTALNDDTAMDMFERWLSVNHGIGASEIFTMAGVWEKDPRFHTANCLSDLDEQR